jgi:hypothetical protein
MLGGPVNTPNDAHDDSGLFASVSIRLHVAELPHARAPGAGFRAKLGTTFTRA